MKKHRKKHSKLNVTTAIVMSLVVLLAVSLLGVLLFYKPYANSNNNGNNSNQTQPSNNTSNQTHPTTPPQSRANITLNKQIPPGYMMGFTADVGLITGTNVVFIQDANQKVSIRFTAKLGGEATKIVIHAFAYAGQPSIRAGLQEDNNGVPAGTWIKENAFATTVLGSNNAFITLQLGAPAILTKGRIYHIVIEPAEDPLNGTPAISTYQADSFAQPLNTNDPDMIWNDSQMNVFSLTNNNWAPQNRWPMFVVTYSDGASEGQPYSLCAQWVVWGSTYVGQSLVPASDYKVGKIAFDVSLGNGIPQDKLYYSIFDASNKILAEGIFVDRVQLSTSQTWIEATLATPVTLKAGELYRIVLLSPQTDLANAYYLFGHEFCYDSSIGYGSLQHQLTSTLTGGETWADNSDADAIFKITTTG